MSVPAVMGRGRGGEEEEGGGEEALEKKVLRNQGALRRLIPTHVIYAMKPNSLPVSFRSHV